ncbi:MAG: ATP-binding protein, partial [bacterium]
DDELIALVEAFQFFNRSTAALNQAYQRLESAAEQLARELKEANSQLQRKNQELDQTHHYLEDILASIQSGVIAADLEGKITIFNRSAEELTGFSAKDVIGRNYQDFLAGELCQKAPLLRTLISGEPVDGLERELPCQNGATLTVKSASSWIATTGGERIGVVETIEDVSQIRALERRIMQQKTLSVLGEMAAQVAHELRNPLAGIKGFASLLFDDLPPNTHGQKMAARIISGVDSLDRIASNLLILTQDCSGEFERQPLEPILDQSISIIEAGSDRAISILRDYPNEPCPAKVDAGKLKQLLLNLIKNACEAMEYHGEMVVGYRANPLTNEIRLTVKDRGPGVSPDILEKIFNPFFSTRQQGTGLGLAIVKKIAELHRGRVEYSAPAEGGGMFTVCFPII